MSRMGDRPPKREKTNDSLWSEEEKNAYDLICLSVGEYNSEASIVCSSDCCKVTSGTAWAATNGARFKWTRNSAKLYRLYLRLFGVVNFEMMFSCCGFAASQEIEWRFERQISEYSAGSSQRWRSSQQAREDWWHTLDWGGEASVSICILLFMQSVAYLRCLVGSCKAMRGTECATTSGGKFKQILISQPL